MPGDPTGLRFQCYHSDSGVGWRLLGNNHRALARSPHGYPSVDEAVAAAIAVSQYAATGTIDLVSQAGTAWRWLMVLGGSTCAVSGASYARRLECLRAVARFRDCAPRAYVDGLTFVGRNRAGQPRTTRLPH